MTTDDRPITRNRIVQRLGTPDRTIGSVNEPREREEHGERFNEKWIYRARDDEPRYPHDLHVYWNRYNFVALLSVDQSGRATLEDARKLVAGINDRLYRPVDRAAAPSDSTRRALPSHQKIARLT